MLKTMDLVLNDIEKQITCMQESLSVTNDLRTKIIKMDAEKNEALEKCAELKAQIERLNKKKCANCSMLRNQLDKERREKKMLKIKEKAKLLKTIAKTLESMDDGNTNQVTNAQQLFTQLVSVGFDDSSEREGKTITLIEDNDSENEADSKVLMNETIVSSEKEETSDGGNTKCVPLIVVPETEAENSCFSDCTTGLNYNNKKTFKKKTDKCVLKENINSTDNEVEMQPVIKKLKCSPVLSKMIARDGSPISQRFQKVDNEKTFMNKEYSRSPSILSDVSGAVQDSCNSRMSGTNTTQEKEEMKWKMKPSILVENNTGAANGKKLKQMTLSLTRPEKTHDISLSEGFKGGMATTSNKELSDNEKDLVLPSPERVTKRTFCTSPVLGGSIKNKLETIDDPDLTVFQPGITSTCLPVDTSFDRLPESQKSPPYKYRRDTVRKREERLKMPGQECDQCAKYYKAAGLDKTQDLRARMNTCSRHRDKYQIRAYTPPGFWDPVLPLTPEENTSFIRKM